MSVTTGCATVQNRQRREIEEMLADFFAMHPTENLTDLFDLPGSAENPEIIRIGTMISFSNEDKKTLGINIQINEAIREITGELFVMRPDLEIPWRRVRTSIPLYFNDGRFYAAEGYG